MNLIARSEVLLEREGLRWMLYKQREAAENMGTMHLQRQLRGRKGEIWICL